MIKLSGILEYSMGGFLCLRGFASFKMLERASNVDPDVQRALIKDHKEEIVKFLNDGAYRFFPEIVLSASLETAQNYEEVADFFQTIQQNKEWGNSKLGEYRISVRYEKTKDKNRIAQITFDESTVKLNRVDGNHRLSAADSVTKDFKTPFCLVLCRTKEEEKQYSTAIFHNINAKQRPLRLEENLSVILNHPEVFSDDTLIKFGMNYFLARKMLDTIEFTYFPRISGYIASEKCSFFVDLYKFLIDHGSIPSDESAVEKLKSQLFDIETALAESDIVASTTNIAVIGALAYYKLSNPSKYRGFLSWVRKNNVGKVEKLRIADVISLYDEIFLHVPQKVFLARWYPSDTDAAYNQSVHRINALKEVIEELNLELTDLGTRDTGSFDIREVMYHDIRECDIFIADLTGARHNVMIEVGYALKHINSGRMIFYFQETDTVKNVPFDVNHFSYDKITDSAEIKTKTKARILRILEQARNGEI